MCRTYFLGLVLLLGAAILGPVRPVAAQFPVRPHIESVMVQPAGILTPADSIELEVTLVAGLGPELYQPTAVQKVGNDISVNIFARLGNLVPLPPAQFVGLLETVPLGTLRPGVYSYSVEWLLPSSPFPPPPMARGSFEVIPEPSTMVMILAGVASLLLAFRVRNASGR
jgi:hypothetical protein